MKYTLTLAFLFLLTFAHAQDTIVRMDSSKIYARVIGVTDKKITYERTNVPNGPVYEISRMNVARVHYANGAVEHYGSEYAIDPIVDKKNTVSATLTDVVSGVMTLNYERLLWNDVGVRLIASRGMLAHTNPSNSEYYHGSTYYSRFKNFSFGLGINYYVYRGEKVDYYLGAMVEYGQVKRRLGGYWGPYPYPTPAPAFRTVDYYMGGITNGISLKSRGPLAMDIFTTLGWRRYSTNDDADLSARIGFNLGYKF